MKSEEQQFHELSLDEIYFRGGGQYTIFTREEMERIALAFRTGDFGEAIRVVEYENQRGNFLTKKTVTAKDILEPRSAQMIHSMAQQLRVHGRDGEISFRTLLPFSTIREFEEALHYRLIAMLEAKYGGSKKKAGGAGSKGTRARSHRVRNREHPVANAVPNGGVGSGPEKQPSQGNDPREIG